MDNANSTVEAKLNLSVPENKTDEFVATISASNESKDNISNEERDEMNKYLTIFDELTNISVDKLQNLFRTVNNPEFINRPGQMLFKVALMGNYQSRFVSNDLPVVVSNNETGIEYQW